MKTTGRLNELSDERTPPREQKRARRLRVRMVVIENGGGVPADSPGFAAVNGNRRTWPEPLPISGEGAG
ncbi:MAG TPA: hypothetical protein VG326_13710 [Tepidisphaeraceae bacterium]|nr:hypothetical protein [Tepidisphaeraceae bacterium]